jgi:hypothetical protein
MAEQFYSVPTESGKRVVLCGACAGDLIDLETDGVTPLKPRADHVCEACEDAINPRDEAYERAVSHARGNDYRDTDGRDWS